MVQCHGGRGHQLQPDRIAVGRLRAGPLPLVSRPWHPCRRSFLRPHLLRCRRRVQALGWRTVKGVAAAVPVCSTSAPPRRWGRRSTLPPCSMSCRSRRRLRCHRSRPSSSIRRLTKYQDLAGLCWGCSCWWEASGAAAHQIPSQRESKFLGDKNTSDDSSCSPPAIYSGIEEEKVVRTSERTAHTRPRVAGAADPTTSRSSTHAAWMDGWSDEIAANTPLLPEPAELIDPPPPPTTCTRAAPCADLRPTGFFTF